MSIKRQELPPGLWVVATPIGNLEDLTPRALRVLQTAEWILCEDTRRTQALFSALGGGAHGKLVRLDAHTQAPRIRQILEESQGQLVALVSDAGTPGVSDPGAQAVRIARGLGIPVFTAPGVSAVVTAVSLCGQELPRGFSFRGFFPRKDRERRQVLEEWMREPFGSASLWFESPERIEGTLDCLRDWENGRSLGRSFFFKELTKLHERSWFSEAGLVPEALSVDLAQDSQLQRGEWGFLLFRGLDVSGSPDPEEAGATNPDGISWESVLDSLLACGVSVSVASKDVSQRFGVQKKRVYQAALARSEKK